MSEHKRCGCVEQYHASDCPACRGTGLIPPVICDEWNYLLDAARDVVASGGNGEAIDRLRDAVREFEHG